MLLHAGSPLSSHQPIPRLFHVTQATFTDLAAISNTNTNFSLTIFKFSTFPGFPDGWPPCVCWKYKTLLFDQMTTTTTMTTVMFHYVRLSAAAAALTTVARSSSPDSRRRPAHSQSHRNKWPRSTWYKTSVELQVYMRSCTASQRVPLHASTRCAEIPPLQISQATDSVVPQQMSERCGAGVARADDTFTTTAHSLLRTGMKTFRLYTQ